MFVGNGFDIHKHSVDASLILGGIEVEGAGFEAHSDGDILLHSLCDALLGSVAKKDLGYYFPSNESTPKDISSVEMLDKVLEIIEIDKLVINNIDITKDQPIYLYCRSGNRSGKAAVMLEKIGFTNVINAGGIDEAAKKLEKKIVNYSE